MWRSAGWSPRTSYSGRMTPPGELEKTSTSCRRIDSHTTSAPIRARGARSSAVASTGRAALDGPAWSISRWAFSTAAACSVPAAGTWVRRTRVGAGAVGVAVVRFGLGGFAEPPFVIVIGHGPPWAGPRLRPLGRLLVPEKQQDPRFPARVPSVLGPPAARR